MTSVNAITVIANCHCLPLADALATCTQGLMTEYIDVVFMNQPQMLAKIDALLAGTKEEHIVFSFNLSERFGTLASPSLRTKLGPRLRTFTNIQFAGLHPDMTYIGPMGKRLVGYFGDYHSKIALLSYATGRSTSDCLKLYNGSTYEKVGFFDALKISETELLERDNNCDIKFAANFINLVKQENCLYSINHPTGIVFRELSRALAADRGLHYIDMDRANFQNHLSNSFVWPVYIEVSDYHRLPYRTPQVFLRSHSRASRALTLKEFVEGSYAAYDAADKNEFTQMVSKLPFYDRFISAL